jgi:hypothetical protein
VISGWIRPIRLVYTKRLSEREGTVPKTSELGRREFLKMGGGGIAGLAVPAVCASQAVSQPSLYSRIEAHLRSVRAIDAHDHLRPPNALWGYVETAHGRGMNLYGLWYTSYYPSTNHLTAWNPGESFDAWWGRAKHDFDNARSTSFYRYMLPAFQELYGIDFDRITDAQARELDQRIFQNYQDKKWIDQVVTQRANIELMIIDPYWSRLDYPTAYRFQARNLNTSSLLSGFHPSEYKDPHDDPYLFARQRNLKVQSLDDFLAVIDLLCKEAKEQGAVCLTDDDTAYDRTLEFDNVPKEQAERAFGRKRSELSPQMIKNFQDFIMWRLVALSARYDLPYQFHTGAGRIQGSSPMLLLNLIEANPKTMFVLMHGGYPWVSDTGAIAFTEMARAKNVWLDSCWLPMISYSMAKRAFHQWLELVPSDRILWGTDSHHAEGIYAAAQFTRRCLGEVLAEKVACGDLGEPQAMQIGTQIMRDNALQVFPRLQARLWKD